MHSHGNKSNFYCEGKMISDKPKRAVLRVKKNHRNDSPIGPGFSEDENEQIGPEVAQYHSSNLRNYSIFPSNAISPSSEQKSIPLSERQSSRNRCGPFLDMICSPFKCR